jgi:uncharacterized protein GlcG (DUF336 family)
MTSGRDVPAGEKRRVDLRKSLTLRFGNGGVAIYTFGGCMAALGVSGLAASSIQLASVSQ